jgi:long-chain acyl-CoA synthetase
MEAKAKAQNRKEEYIYTRFYESCAKYPKNTAIIYLGEKFSYEQLQEHIERFATGLTDLGVKKDDRVIIYTTNCPQWIIAFFAIQIIGANAVPISPIYTSHELEYMANDAGAETVICLDTNYCYVKEILSTTSVKRVIVTNLVDMLPVYKRAIGFLFDKVPNGSYEKGAQVFKFKKILSYPRNPPKADIDAWRNISFILYTGGTTGFPKGVPLNHMGVITYLNDMGQSVLEGHVGRGGEDTYICVNPLFHIMAFAYFMCLVLNRGNRGILMPAPQVDSILGAIEQYGVTLFLGVPALYRMVLENDRLETYDLSTLRYSFCGGDKLPTEMFRRWQEKFGIPIHQVYGTTEMGFTTHHRLHENPDPENLDVGAPLPTRKCLICDPETLEPLANGETGELLVTSEYIIKEYLNKPEETARSFVKVGDEIYYRTGDYVQFDSEGRVHYVDRSADLIKYKGYRISASEIEAVLQDHDAVTAACVVGVPDPKVGERIKAMVVMREDARGVGASDLLKFCRERLASYKMPKYIEFRDMLPKSKVGKLLRREVRDEEMRKTAKEKKIAI